MGKEPAILHVLAQVASCVCECMFLVCRARTGRARRGAFNEPGAWVGVLGLRVRMCHGWRKWYGLPPVRQARVALTAFTRHSAQGYTEACLELSCCGTHTAQSQSIL